MDRASSVFWVILSLAMLEEARLLPFGTVSRPRAGFYPFILGAILAILSFIFMLKSWMRRRQSGVSGGLPDRKGWRNVLIAFAAMFLFYLLFESLGFLLTTFLMLFLLMKLVNPRPWFYSAWVSAIVALSAYVTFDILLRANLPKGVLEPWLF
jgi:putative tricarboxylic transport membrane protein